MKVPGMTKVLSNGNNNNDSKHTLCLCVPGTALGTLHVLAYLIPDKVDTITIPILQSGN